MKLNLFILVFALGFLTACNIKEISDLEDQVQDLKKQLEETTDPATMTKLQKAQFVEKQIALVREKEKEQKILFAELEGTTDKKSCEILALKIKKLTKEIEDIEQQYTIISSSSDNDYLFSPLEDSPLEEDRDDTCIDDGYSGYSPFIEIQRIQRRIQRIQRRRLDEETEEDIDEE